MKKVTVKNTDLEIAPINFGGNVFGWTLDEKESFNILNKFTEGGFNFIDTADTYSWWVNGKGGQSEEIIGKWMKERKNRQDIVLATKVGSETKEHGFDISKKHILKSVDESLQRLGTDYIDLYYTHFDDKGKAVLAALDKVSEKHQSQPATVALAWLLANPLITAPIVSATSERQLQTIFDAPKLELGSEDLEILNQASK